MARRRRQEPLDDRLQVTAPHEWLLAVGLGLTFLALLAYGAVGSVERSLSWDAVVVFPGERYPVSAPVSGTVAEVLAELGDTVEPGEVIARLRPTAERQRDFEARRLIESLAERLRRNDEAAADLLPLLLALTGGGDAAGSGAWADIVSVTGGEIMTLDLAPGMPVLAGEPVALVREASSGPPEALALVPSDEAGRLEAGMTARVSLARFNRVTGIYPAEVAAVSARATALPEWLAGLGMSAPEGSHLVRARLEDTGPDDAVADVSMGALRVVLGRSSFLSLLAPGGGF